MWIRPVFLSSKKTIVCFLNRGKALFHLRVPATVFKGEDRGINLVDFRSVENSGPMRKNLVRLQYARSNYINIRKAIVPSYGSLSGIIILYTSLGLISLYTLKERKNSPFLFNAVPREKQADTHPENETRVPYQVHRIDCLESFVLENPYLKFYATCWSVVLLEKVTYNKALDRKPLFRLRTVQLNQKKGLLVLGNQQVLPLDDFLTSDDTVVSFKCHKLSKYSLLTTSGKFISFKVNSKKNELKTVKREDLLSKQLKGPLGLGCVPNVVSQKDFSSFRNVLDELSKYICFQTESTKAIVCNMKKAKIVQNVAFEERNSIVSIDFAIHASQFVILTGRICSALEGPGFVTLIELALFTDVRGMKDATEVLLVKIALKCRLNPIQCPAGGAFDLGGSLGGTTGFSRRKLC